MQMEFSSQLSLVKSRKIKSKEINASKRLFPIWHNHHNSTHWSDQQGIWTQTKKNASKYLQIYNHRNVNRAAHRYYQSRSTCKQLNRTPWQWYINLKFAKLKTHTHTQKKTHTQTNKKTKQLCDQSESMNRSTGPQSYKNNLCDKTNSGSKGLIFFFFFFLFFCLSLVSPASKARKARMCMLKQPFYNTVKVMWSAPAVQVVAICLRRSHSHSDFGCLTWANQQLVFCTFGLHALRTHSSWTAAGKIASLDCFTLPTK